MVVKTSELTGAALDYAVAVALGWECERQQDSQFINEYGDRKLVGYYGFGNYEKSVSFNPSTNWAHGGLLIDRFNMWLTPPVLDIGGWNAEVYSEDRMTIVGNSIDCKTALIAICRAVVACKLGDSVDIPTELMEGE